MSILIKGMEMPTGGHTVTITIAAIGKAFVEYYDCRPHVTEDIEYKAVPVPPHGRLIDADALLGNLPVEYPSIVYAIETAQTIIPAEEGEKK